jgi:hypothetical protein
MIAQIRRLHGAWHDQAFTALQGKHVSRVIFIHYPLVMTNSLRKWPSEFADLPIKHGDFP